ncbi:hypothetical protein [Luteolibacter sp. Populi]|uniref:hypothetical protein n=1 Tax=Luteolibacter sp. Populi TaxID=3230487 RepID=UPI003467E4D5
MATIITKQHAEKIAKKLGAKYFEGKAHTIAQIFEDGVLVAEFGIRRGSQRDQGHDHVQSDLYLNGNNAKLLANCPLTRAKWVEIMKEKGVIASDLDELNESS